MAETNQDIYVRKDVFDARMDRLELLIEKNGTEIQAYIDSSINGVRGEIQQVKGDLQGEIQGVRGEIQQVKSDLQGEIQGLRGEIQQVKGDLQGLRGEIQQVKSDLQGEIQGVRAEVRVLEGRVDNLSDVVYWGIGGFAVILASAVILPTVIGFLKKIFAPSLTIEDVERIVEAAISRHLSGNLEAR